MSESHPAFAMAETDIDDVELEDDDIQEKSVEELVDEAGSEAREAIESFEEVPGDGGAELDKADPNSGDEIEVPGKEVDTDEELIKRVGMGHFDVDTGPTEAEQQLDELAEKSDEVEPALREEDVDPRTYVTDTFAKTAPESDEDDVAKVADMDPQEQAEHLAKEVAEVVDVSNIAEKAADLPRSNDDVAKVAKQSTYKEITKFVEAVYEDDEIDKSVLETVRSKFVTRAGRTAKVLSAS